jgi:hypothetical protein
VALKSCELGGGASAHSAEKMRAGGNQRVERDKLLLDWPLAGSLGGESDELADMGAADRERK